MSNINQFPIDDFSLGVQAATSWKLKKANELARGINLNFTKLVGAVTRKDGNQQAGGQFSTVPNIPTGGHVAKYSTGAVRMVAVNNTGGTATIIRTQNTGTGVWSDLAGISYPVNAVVFFLDYLDEVYITGFDPATGDPITPYNVDNTLNVSASRNILFMPAGYFLVEFLGVLYMCNVKIGAVRYADRFYKASPPLGYITTIQGAQTDPPQAVVLTDTVPTMVSNTSPQGVAAASSIFNSSFDAFHAFDDVNTINNKWVAASGTVTGNVSYDYGSGVTKIITYYSITGVPADENLPNRAPKTWTFEGSNNGSTWTTLDARTNVPAWSMGEKRVYAVNNTTGYRYYRVNVSANQGDSTILAIAELEFMTITSGSKDLLIKVDSVRYIKPGMVIDLYKGGTDVKNYTFQIGTVDKVNNQFTITPFTLQFASTDVTTAADSITMTGNASNFPTGTPIKFATNSSLPAPLVADTVYYSIFIDANTIKVATTLTNAQTGVAIDITTQGTGPHYIRLSYVFADNDELWLTGRKNKLSVFWNVDYPIPEATGEWFALKPGVDSQNIISGASKSSNRLFVWGKNSGTRWDGQNLVVFNNTTGCISHRSIGNIDDDWIIWLDAKAQIWARNESSGQQELISKPVKNYLQQMTMAQLKAANCAISGNVYKLYLGTINGENIRLSYDFDSNTWSPERLIVPQIIGAGTDDDSGVLRPYYFSNDGYLYMDEVGNTDGGKAISFEMGTGRNNLGTNRLKRFYGALIFGNNISGLKLECAVDGGQFKPQGEIEGKVAWVPFPESGDNALRRGVTIDTQIMSSIEGDPPSVEGMVLFYIPEEDVPSERRYK